MTMTVVYLADLEERILPNAAGLTEVVVGWERAIDVSQYHLLTWRLLQPIRQQDNVICLITNAVNCLQTLCDPGPYAGYTFFQSHFFYGHIYVKVS